MKTLMRCSTSSGKIIVKSDVDFGVEEPPRSRGIVRIIPARRGRGRTDFQQNSFYFFYNSICVVTSTMQSGTMLL